MLRKFVLFVFCLALALPVTAQALPDLILVERPGLTPEGIEWDAEAEHFLLGSLAEGTIYAVQDDGTSTPFIQDPDLISSVGIEVDAQHGRLLVANADHAAFANRRTPRPIALGIYDLETGERLHMVDLTELGGEGQHFANDVAVDGAGNAYVTDSFAPVIYQVDLDGVASVLVQDDRLGHPFLGLNGIAYHPDGFLLVALTGAGQLLKVPLDDPNALSVVETDFLIFDGLVIATDGTLYGVNGLDKGIYALQSSDGWQSAQVAEKINMDDQATTITWRAGQLYALYAHLSISPPPDVYEIVRVPLGE